MMRKSIRVLALLALSTGLPGCWIFSSTGAAGRRESFVDLFTHDADGASRLAPQPDSSTDATPAAPESGGSER